MGCVTCTAGMRVEPPTRMISSTSSFSTEASSSSFVSGPLQRLNRSALSCSKRVRDSVSATVSPPSPATSTVAWCAVDSVRLASSTCNTRPIVGGLLVERRPIHS